MGKWSKPQSQISEEFMQNQERRKQMIVQAARRRKQKQKKMQEQEEIQRKREEDAFSKHKQEKKQAYVKYLRNNMHDKYEQAKRNQKLNQPEVRSASKWKTKDKNQLEGLDLEVGIKHTKQQIKKSYEQSSKVNNYQANGKKGAKQLKKEEFLTQKRRMLQKQFQKMWEDQNQIEQQMIGSKLMDSLDLDFGTVSRGIQINKQIKLQDSQQKQLNNIKNLIGYQSILMSIDERDTHRKMFKNQIQSQEQPKKDQNNNKVKKVKSKQQKQQKQKQQKPANQGELLNELKNKKQGKILNWANQDIQQADDLFSNCSTSSKRGHKTLMQINKQIKKQRQQKQKNKNLPQTSYNTNTRQTNSQKLISNVNNHPNINMKKKDNAYEVLLEPIPQRKVNMSRQKLRGRSYQKKQKQKSAQQIKLQREESKNKIKQNLAHLAKERSMQRLKASRQKQTTSNQPQSGQSKKWSGSSQKNHQNDKNSSKNIPLNKSRTNSTQIIRNNKTTNGFSKQKINTNENRATTSNSASFRLKNQPNQPNKYQQTSSKQNNAYNETQYEQNKKGTVNQPSYFNTGLRHPPIPVPYRQNDSMTIATQDQVFQVQSFIKNQLVSLNKEERQLQEQIKQLHILNKQKLKEVQQKYQIRTNYKHSYQIDNDIDNNNNKHDDEQSNQSYKSLHKKQTQDQLQQSLQRLDDMLLRKEIQQKEKNSRITQQDEQSSTSSFINPMSDPISLHKQVLQLAQNISRFQQQVEVQDGYRQKMMKKKQPKNNQKSNKLQQVEMLAQSRDISQIQLQNDKSSKKLNIKKPPILDYCQKKQNINNYEFEDSIDAIQCKINVNERLKKMLLNQSNS